MIRHKDLWPTDDELRAVAGNSGPGWPVVRKERLEDSDNSETDADAGAAGCDGGRDDGRGGPGV